MSCGKGNQGDTENTSKKTANALPKIVMNLATN